MADEQMMSALDLTEVEAELCRLPDVTAVRLVADPIGRPLELHVLAHAGKPAKQIVRDVQSVALASFGLEVDRRIVSVVQLSDDRYAIVTSVNSSRPLKPRVLVHEPRAGRDTAVTVDLEATPGLGIRRSLKPQYLPRSALDVLSPRPRVCYFFERARELELTASDARLRKEVA